MKDKIKTKAGDVVCGVIPDAEPELTEAEIIDDAQAVRAGNRAEAVDRARDVSDGTVMPVAPEDVRPQTERDDLKEVNFEDRSSRNDHGRNLV